MLAGILLAFNLHFDASTVYQKVPLILDMQ